MGLLFWVVPMVPWGTEFCCVLPGLSRRAWHSFNEAPVCVDMLQHERVLHCLRVLVC